MKIVGLIGGTSWHSTIEYYRYINEFVNNHFGDNTNPPLMLYTLNQSLIHESQRKGDWATISEMILDAADRLQRGGAEALMMCANTPHKVFDVVNAQTSVPMIHICDTTADAIRAKGLSRAGLIGTRFSMQEKFLVDRFAMSGVEVLTPEPENEIVELHRIIQEELTFGRIEAKSKRYVLESIASLVERGAEGIVLGCTEFPLMLAADEIDVPTFNTTEIHAIAAAKYLLSE